MQRHADARELPYLVPARRRVVENEIETAEMAAKWRRSVKVMKGLRK